MKWVSCAANLWLGCVACGSVSSTPDGGATGSDARTDAAPDAPAAPRCNPMSAFATPIPLTALNTGANENGATLSADELTLYFCSNRPGGPGGGDIWFATRPSKAANWGTAQILPTINTSTMGECVTSISGDGLTMYLHVSLNNSLDIALSTRTSISGAWGAYTIPGLPFNASAADGHAHVSPDGNTVYFASSRDGMNEDLMYVKRVNGVWGTAMAVPGIPTAAIEVSPIISGDELSLFYESYSGGGEIMLATRLTTDRQFRWDPTADCTQHEQG